MDSIIYEKSDRVVRITLNRPEVMNSFNRELIEGISAAWQRFKDDKDSWVAILSGAGERAFSAGVDIQWTTNDPAAADTPETLALIRLISPRSHNLWKPVIAAINGYCLGLGWWLAQGCDLRIAVEEAQLGIPESKLNILPFFAGELREYFSPAMIAELLFTGDTISAQRAYEIGFLNKVVPRNELGVAARNFADRICSSSPVAVRRIKEYLHLSNGLSTDQSVSLRDYMIQDLLAMEDSKEATNAILEKRKPIWKEC
jgi:enoyl-CoA hydratase/carnithine racemase